MICECLSSAGFIHLVQRNVLNRRSVDLQDPITNMNGVLDIWTDALWVHPEHTDRSRDMSHRSSNTSWEDFYWALCDLSLESRWSQRYLCRRGESQTESYYTERLVLKILADISLFHCKNFSSDGQNRFSFSIIHTFAFCSISVMMELHIWSEFPCSTRFAIVNCVFWGVDGKTAAGLPDTLTVRLWRWACVRGWSRWEWSPDR